MTEAHITALRRQIKVMYSNDNKRRLQTKLKKINYENAKKKSWLSKIFGL